MVNTAGVQRCAFPLCAFAFALVPAIAVSIPRASTPHHVRTLARPHAMPGQRTASDCLRAIAPAPFCIPLTPDAPSEPLSFARARYLTSVGRARHSVLRRRLRLKPAVQSSVRPQKCKPKLTVAPLTQPAADPADSVATLPDVPASNRRADDQHRHSRQWPASGAPVDRASAPGPITGQRKPRRTRYGPRAVLCSHCALSALATQRPTPAFDTRPCSSAPSDIPRSLSSILLLKRKLDPSPRHVPCSPTAADRARRTAPATCKCAPSTPGPCRHRAI